MRKMFFVIAALVSAVMATAQQPAGKDLFNRDKNTFSFTDSLVQVGDVMTRRLVFRNDQPTAESYPVMDSIAHFMMEHEAIRMDIIVHTSSEGDAKANDDKSRRQAELIKVYLSKEGVPLQRLAAVGAGESDMLISEKESQQLSPDARKKADVYNQRVEFKIVASQ
jgi:outer membrane protein OmpA-like peptidoglycan-associated protein